jgi:acyl carrier protein
MSQTFAFDDLKRVLVDRVGLDEELVVDDPEATFEDMGLDSLAFFEVQLAMQQEYGFNIPEEDASRITTVGDAIQYVNEKLAEKE